MFETAIDAQQRLVVVEGTDELRTALDSPAEIVVIDLPEPARIDAWERVRSQHDGMVLVAVDSQAETREWPPDVARRFLVRPLHSEEIVAALAVRPRILREPAAARRRRLAQARRTPVVPPPVPDPPLPEIEPVRRLSSGESLWEAPAETPGATGPAAMTPQPAKPALPEPPAANPEPAADAAGSGSITAEAPAGEARGQNGGGPERHRLRLILATVLLLATAAAGIAIGRATASPGRSGPETVASTPGAPSSSASTAAPGVVIQEKTPAACDAALADADAALSYLVGNIRDQRLSQSMQRYQEHRRACRLTSR
jgi:hypothetical protein